MLKTTFHKRELKRSCIQQQHPSVSLTRLYLEIEAIKGTDHAKANSSIFFLKSEFLSNIYFQGWLLLGGKTGSESCQLSDCLVADPRIKIFFLKKTLDLTGNKNTFIAYD